MFRKKNLTAANAKVGLVQMKGFFEIIFLYKYYRVKYFRPYYTPFVNENIFFARRSRHI